MDQRRPPMFIEDPPEEPEKTEEEGDLTAAEKEGRDPTEAEIDASIEKVNEEIREERKNGGLGPG